MTLRPLAPALLALAAFTAPAAAQSWQTMSSSRQLHGEKSLTVDVNYAAGTFDLQPAASGDLYRMQMRYDEDRYTALRDYDPASGELHLGLQGRGGREMNVRGNQKGGYLSLALTPDVPMALDIRMGAARADAEFGGLALTSLSYETGASQSRVRFSRPNAADCDELSFQVGAAQFTATNLGNSHCRRMSFEGGVGSVTLDFGGSWRGSADATVHVAIGSVHLRLPRDIGVVITLDRFLASFDQAGFTKRGDAWYSDNFETARQRLNLHVQAAFGGIDVDWIN